MSYKAQPIYEGGAVAKSIAALCRQFTIDPEYVKLEVSFKDGKCRYHLHGRASAYFSFDEKAATYEEVEIKVCRALEQWRTHGVDGDATPASEAAAKPALEARYITQAQKEEIIQLLCHPLITREEKTKTMLNLNRLDEERAANHIAKLRKAIEDREGIRLAA